MARRKAKEPKCTTCEELNALQRSAQATFDHSAMADVVVLRERHVNSGLCTRQAAA